VYGLRRQRAEKRGRKEKEMGKRTRETRQEGQANKVGGGRHFIKGVGGKDSFFDKLQTKKT